MKKTTIKIKDISKQTKQREFFTCDCHGEGIIIDDEVEIYKKEKFGTHNFHFALWQYGQDGINMSFKQKIRWCWHIIKRGVPWTDCIIMQSVEAEKFANSILKRIYIGKKMMQIHGVEK